MLTLCDTDKKKKIILMLYDTDIYDTHVVFITMIQRLMAKYHSQIILQHVVISVSYSTFIIAMRSPPVTLPPVLMAVNITDEFRS